jgi:biopolymer transport protein ExbD
MNLVPLFAVMFGLLVINTVIIFYLLAKYKEAKHEAFINRPPF